MVSLLLLLACHGPAKTPGDGGDDTAPSPDDTGGGGSTGVPCSETANLELVPLDVWGRDLTGTTLSTSVEGREVDDPSAGPGVELYPLGRAAFDLGVRWDAADHLTLATVLHWDGAALTVDPPSGAGLVAWSSDTRVIDGRTCPVFTAYFGVEHAWFAPSADPPTHNTAHLHMDGEPFWQDVADVLLGARERVTWATWWWESDFELLRPAGHTSESASERWANTAMGMMETLDGVERRVLVNRFWADNSDYTEYLNTDTELRDRAERGGDDFEVMLQGNNTEVPLTSAYQGEAAPVDFVVRVRSNPRYADRAVSGEEVRSAVVLAVEVASWHQKVMVFDGATAFVGGMNTKASDWDSHEHLVYDARRMDFDASRSEREAVAAMEELPDSGPRKDYGVRVDGPAAADVEELIASRWRAAIDAGEPYSEHASELVVGAPAAEDAAGPLVQVVATMPEPWATMAIGESHGRAFSQASHYVYVEDQYFRAPMMNELLVARMTAEPDLVLIVVTKPVSVWDGGAKYTWISDETFRSMFPDRYLLLQLRSTELLTDPDAWGDEAEVVVQDIDTHSKIRVVDDRYVSVGSCNFNNRGYLYEGEMDVAVLDDTFATDARERVFENLVGPEWAGLLSDDARNNFDVLRMAAAENQERLDWWVDHAGDLDADEAEAQWRSTAPSGFVYPLQIDDDYEWDVGPDAF